MGNEPSTTRTSRGTLKGASAGPVSGRLPQVTKTRHAVSIPRGKRAGDTFTTVVDGVSYWLKVEKGQNAGDRIWFETDDIDKMFASTLPEIPGMNIVQAKPIIFGSVSTAFYPKEKNDGRQHEVGEKVGPLMQQAQQQILHQAAAVGCNAVLGMTFNVSSDSGEDGMEWGCGRKGVIVTACGTPCCVVPKAEAEIAVAEANIITEPVKNF